MVEFCGNETEIRLKVIGVGGGGCSVLRRLCGDDVTGMELMAVNTDQDSVSILGREGAEAIQIGQQLTHGQGTGGRPEIGAQAAEEALEELRQAVRGVDMVFLTACLGGGTGSGAVPVIARLAKEEGALSLGIVTMPFRFEGKRRRQNARTAIAGLRDQLDALILVRNDDLLALPDSRKLSLADAFRAADDVLRQGIRLITSLIFMTGVINVDFADFRTVLRQSASSDAILGIGESPDGSALEAVRQALASPLLFRTIEGARDIILNVVGDESLSLEVVREAADYLRAQAHPDLNMILGSAFDKSMAGRVQAMLVATNFDEAAGVVGEAAP